MRIHYLQHVQFEDLANIGLWAQAKGHPVTGTRLYAGQGLPLPEQFDWLIIMGGPMNIYEEKKYPWLLEEKKFIEKAIKARKTVLGICLGAQLIADVLGGQVLKNKYKEIGWFPVSLTPEALHNHKTYSLPESFIAFQWHSDSFTIPSGCTRLAESEACTNQAFEYNERVLGLQFHLESSRESVANLIKNCGDEIVPGRYLQSPDFIRDQQNYFEQIYTSMETFLNYLADKSGQ